MRILWITNILFPDFYECKGIKAPVLGGWMKALADSLKKLYPGLEIAVASPFEGVSRIEEKTIGEYRYYALPAKINCMRPDPSVERLWKDVKNRYMPDLIHIHGTEFTHGLGWVRANGRKGVVVSIQGLISVYARYRSGGIGFDRRKDIGIIHRLRGMTPEDEIRKYESGGEFERLLIRSVDHVIGRTLWDRSHVWAINPDCNYHFGNENLRPLFYSSAKWNVDSCRHCRIFLSQGAVPIKGLHKVIEALPLILRYFPDTEVYVAGDDCVRTDSIKDKLRISCFGRYINRMLSGSRLSDKIHFMGPIEAAEMVEQYRLANVFVCPSSIENSPNSLGEAQLIGTPVVASYTGGIPDMVENGRTGLLYRFEETEMLAYAVCRIFGNKDLASFLSVNEIAVASARHDVRINAAVTMEIYNLILGNEISSSSLY